MDEVNREELSKQGLDESSIDDILNKVQSQPNNAPKIIEKKLKEAKIQELEEKIKNEPNWKKQAALVAQKISLDLE